MPVVHRGANPRGQHCQGCRLDKNHDELACHAQGEKRNEIIKLLNCWVDTIENDCSVKKKKHPEPCSDYVLCYPEYKCERGMVDLKKKPLCVEGTGPFPMIPKTNCYEEKPLWKRDDPAPPIWDRPRVKSAQLIGGDFRKVKECFRANGLNDFDYCPRTQSCELMQCLNEMIEADRKLHGPDVITPDCCCRPGDAPSRMPQYPCMSCDPPTQYGYKDVAGCPAEVGRHGEHHDRAPHAKGCPHAHHRVSALPDLLNKPQPRTAEPRRAPRKSEPQMPTKFNHTPSVQEYTAFRRNPNDPASYRACLNMNNPRSSGEIWTDLDLNILGSAK